MNYSVLFGFLNSMFFSLCVHLLERFQAIGMFLGRKKPFVGVSKKFQSD